MIYALPGMGADQRMYSGAWKSLPNCAFLKWPTHAGEDSISAVVRRIAADHKIRAGDIVIGSSLGAIAACEIAKIIPIGGLVLIGGAKRKEEINALLAFIHPLVDLAPLAFIQRVSGKVPDDLSQMFSDGDPGFIRAMCRAIFDWEGLGDTHVNLLRIHGRKDRVIPLPEGVQHVLNGGHLIAMTHSQQCVEIIKTVS
ncbi:MAG TPA: alpha/beta fold hydrolase [Verrucomicrobiae bacterium]|jgi:pimeloyl-ACP methyl ester carboxylesterase|nr:alpha/beta fold hydrolase [Verrucomicrobiae bacterium]